MESGSAPLVLYIYFHSNPKVFENSSDIISDKEDTAFLYILYRMLHEAIFPNPQFGMQKRIHKRYCKIT